jgi:hypothetical protein
VAANYAHHAHSRSRAQEDHNLATS